MITSVNELTAWLNFVAQHPHYFTIQYPPGREYFVENFRRSAQAVDQWMADVDQLLVYVHVPFCETRCDYCNFAIDTRPRESIHQEYVEALLRELDSHRSWLEKKSVLALDIGGGTPMRLSTANLNRLFNGLAPWMKSWGLPTDNPCALSIETTPRIAAQEPQKLQILRAGGINRISMGVQTFHDPALICAHRQAQIDMAEKAMSNLRQAGFARINLDVIFGLPNQTLAAWHDDVARLIQLAPDSITTYDCLYRGQGRGLSRRHHQATSPRLFGEMYDLAFCMLTKAGWQAPYGSVNFSRIVNETGTSAYFEGRLLDGRPYLGLGNYATSLRGDHWSFNTYAVADYVHRVQIGAPLVDYYYQLRTDESQAKYCLCSLNFGLIDEARFSRRFGRSLTDAFAHELEVALDAGWLERRQNKWFLVPGHFAHMHFVRALFYSHHARRWLMSRHPTA